MIVWRWLRTVVWPFVVAVTNRYIDDEGWVLAGYLAYSAMLALMPFLIFATALTGLVIGPERGEAALDLLFTTAPEHVARTLEPVILEVVGTSPGSLLTVTAVGVLYAASSGVEALRLGLDRAYDVEAYRHIAYSWLIAIGVVIVGFVIFMLIAVLIILAPIVFAMFEALTGVDVPMQADLIRYGFGFGLLAAALYGMHWVLPSRRMRGLRLWPGILFSIVAWGALAILFSIYLSYAPYYTVTYGTLAGVVITLLFMYLTASIIIIGAEMNAIVNHDELARRGARRAKRNVPPEVH